MSRLVRGAAAALFAILATPGSGTANPQSETLRARAAAELYNLDHERAIASYRDAVAADPKDSGAHRGLAGALWIDESFQRGTMTVDSYLGGVSRSNVKVQPPPGELLREFEAVTGRAIEMARKKIAGQSPGPRRALPAWRRRRAARLVRRDD